MPLTRLDITNFRNLRQIKVHPATEGLNCFYGLNGSGKTSLLEAIYYLSRGRSFRCSVPQRLINHEAERFSIFSQVSINHSQIIPVGTERNREGDIKIRAAGQDLSLPELLGSLPVLLLNSFSYNLLEGGPLFRRKYLDWSAFYHSSQFLSVWKSFERALKQRNACLKSAYSINELSAWTNELIHYADKLNYIRQETFNLLLPHLEEMLAELLPFPNIKVSFYPGWTGDYKVVLASSEGRDRLAAFTHQGPHRADIKLHIGGVPLKDILSRGQQKLFVCAMIVAQGALLQKCMNKKPIYLIDDLPSELDLTSRTRLISILLKQQAQLFLTAVESEAIALCSSAPVKMFHVEQGNVMELTSPA